MKTSLMMKKAQLNGKTYTIGNLSYSRDKSIHFLSGERSTVYMDSVIHFLERFMEHDTWVEVGD